MTIKNGFRDAIGNTPLIRLNNLSQETGCEILGKAEFMNPGGSVKDRAALWIINEAEKRGELTRGSTVVEGTAGNTGIGIALICYSSGYECVIYMPDNQSPEKIQLLKTLGAEVRVVPTVPYADDNHYQKQAGRFAADLDTGIWANQFDNTDNKLAHYSSTGPEIWIQTAGSIDAFGSSVGTGGTLAGVSNYLKEQNPNIKAIIADCYGSALYNFISTGQTVMTPGPSITEGIGNSRVTQNFESAKVDWAEQIPDAPMVKMVYRLLNEEGLFLGSSSGINVCGAVEVAKKWGQGIPSLQYFVPEEKSTNPVYSITSS